MTLLRTDEILARPLGGGHEAKVRAMVPAAESGVLPPIRVRRALGEGGYTIRDGRHRYWAHVTAGLVVIEVLVV